MKHKKTLALLQARMSSSRLPGKVLKTIVGKPMLELHLERLSRCRKIDQLVVVTSIDSEDGAIEDLCKRLGINCFRGDLTNVLDRFYRAYRCFGADIIVRLTGDCPLADPGKIDELVTFFKASGCDYASNCTPRSLPHGLDAEIFTGRALETCWKKATTPDENEHVTPYMRYGKNGFKITHLEYDPVNADHRWTVDEPEDFELVTEIYEALYHKDPYFTTEDIIHLLTQRPDLKKINARFTT